MDWMRVAAVEAEEAESSSGRDVSLASRVACWFTADLVTSCSHGRREGYASVITRGAAVVASQDSRPSFYAHLQAGGRCQRLEQVASERGADRGGAGGAARAAAVDRTRRRTCTHTGMGPFERSTLGGPGRLLATSPGDHHLIAWVVAS